MREYKTYTVSVNFAGFIGCDEEYEVEASSPEEAIEEARQMAEDDLSFEIVEEEEDE